VGGIISFWWAASFRYGGRDHLVLVGGLDRNQHPRLMPSNLWVRTLALQLRFCFEVRSLSDRLVSSSPERPCDDVRGLDPLSSEPDGDAADFLD
jgi:hypothetical protein